MSIERRTRCVRIEAKDGTIVRVAAEYPHSIEMSNGSIYDGGQFTTPSSRGATSSGESSVIDLGFVETLSSIDLAQIESGKWDNADIFLFATDWANPVEDDVPLTRYTMGKITQSDNRYEAQLMGMLDKLNSESSRVITATCLYTFADYLIDGSLIASDKSRCKLDHSGFVVTGTVDSISDIFTINDAERTEPLDWFGNGQIRFTTGNNAGLDYRFVRAYDIGEIIIQTPFYYEVQSGDQYEMIAGCRKRADDDCRDKFNNKKRFGGFDRVPQQSDVIKFGGQS